jgi:hypothetical protein
MQAAQRVSVTGKDSDTDSGSDARSRSGSISPKDNKVQDAANGSKVLTRSFRQKFYPDRPVVPVPAPAESALSGSLVKLAVNDTVNAKTSNRSSIGASNSSPILVDKNTRHQRARSLRGVPAELRDTNGKLKLSEKVVPPLIAQLKLNGFSTITEHMIACMKSEERISLKMALEEARKLKGTEEVDKCLQMHQTVTEQRLDAQLVELICNKGAIKIDEFRTVDLWSLLFVSSESIVPTERLFTLILNEIRNNQPKADPEEKLSPRVVKTIKLQMFCLKWLEENRSNALVAKAKDSIEAIVALTDTDASGEIKVQCERLRKELAVALQPLPAPELSIPSAKSPRKLFGDCKDLADDSTNIKSVARDLMQYQMLLFRNLTPSHLIEAKWGKGRSFLNMISGFNVAITEFLVDLVLGQPDREIRANILKFLIKVEKTALDADDFATAFAIYLACNNSEVGRLRSTWELVLKSSSCRKILEDHNQRLTLFDNSKILRGLIDTAYTEFRKQQDKAHRFVPCLHLILGDITHCGEQPRVLLRPGCEPEFHFENMAKICSLIQQILMPQRVMKSDEEFALLTDLLPAILSHKRNGEAERKILSERYDPPRSSPRD